MLFVLNYTSAPSTTKSSAFMPSANILMNGALSSNEGLQPVTFRQRVVTIASLVVKYLLPS